MSFGDFLFWAKAFSKFFSGTVYVLRAIHGQGLVVVLRDRTAFPALQPLHTDTIHAMRDFAVHAACGSSPDTMALAARTFCTHARESMGKLLELPMNQLHCCIKVIASSGTDQAQDRIATYMRSEPMDDRRIDDLQTFTPAGNTVWAAMYGLSDGRTQWRGVNCFSCNDLAAHADKFVCSRSDWGKYYRSTLVFPLRYAKNAVGTELCNFGYLAFDSPRVNAFRGMPDVFVHHDNPSHYSDLLFESSVFHLGAIMADSLGIMLGPSWNRINQGT